MRVILIDPWNQTIFATSKLDGYRDYYRLLSGASPEGLRHTRVDCFDITMVNSPANHLLVVDDEGFLKAEQAFFHLDGRTFAGRGVLVGGGAGEEEGPASASLDDVVRLVTWIPLGTKVCIGRPTIRSFETPEELIAFLNGE